MSGRKSEPALNIREAGARGGRTTLERYGADFYQRIGKKGGRKTKELYGNLLREFGKRGGRPHRPSLSNMGETTSPQKKEEPVGPVG
jgi:general stress protein YciG